MDIKYGCMNMKREIFRSDWHMLTGEQILSLFNDHFPSVTIQPNIDIVERLRVVEVATLELMENRSASTVYRIRQYDEVYHLFQPNGDCFLYDTEDYYTEQEVDTLLQRYVKKEPVFRFNEQKGPVVEVEYLRQPPFRCTFENGEYKGTTWLGEEPTDISLIARLLRKAGAFYSQYYKEGGSDGA